MPTIEGWQPRINASGNFVGGQFTCPHCGFRATFTVISIAHHRGRNCAALACDSTTCGKITYVETADNWNSGRPTDYFPKGTVPGPHQSIPKHIADDWFEAQQDFENGALTSAALMCRRVLYGVLLEKGCAERPLQTGIEELARKAGLPHLLLDKLREIKEDGHDAAHPSRTLQLDSANVEEIVQYTEDLLKWVYEEPWRLQQRYARHNASAGDTSRS